MHNVLWLISTTPLWTATGFTPVADSCVEIIKSHVFRVSE